MNVFPLLPFRFPRVASILPWLASCGSPALHERKSRRGAAAKGIGPAACHLVSCWKTLVWVILCFMIAATGQAQTHYTAPTEPVGTASSTQTVTMSITASGTLSNINVLMLGSPDLDYRFQSGGSCTIGTTYDSGASCTVEYAFLPEHPGSRFGGITLTTSSGTVMGTVYLTGIGNGPQPAFTTSTGVPSIQLGGGFTDPLGLDVDGSGAVYVADNTSTQTNSGNNVVWKIPEGCDSAACAIQLGGTFNFDDLIDIAVDGAGNLLVLDGFLKPAVYEMPTNCTSSSCVQTLASGFSFYNPSSISVDGSGNAYVTDTNSNLTSGYVYQISPGCQSSSCVTTRATTGFGGLPEGAAVDANGNLFLTVDTVDYVLELPPGCNSNSSTDNCSIEVAGPESNAEPSRVRVDGSGNIYWVSNAGGVVETSANCPNLSCWQLLGPPYDGLYVNSVAVDATGNAYFAAGINNTNQAVGELNIALPTSHVFASTSVTTTSSDSPFTSYVINNGNTALTFSQQSMSSSNFTLDSSSGMCSTSNPLAAYGTCNLAISFTPQMSGILSGTLDIFDDSLNESTEQQIVVDGTGTTGTLSQSVTFPALPSTPLGGTSATLTATATSGLPVTYLVISGPAMISGSTLNYTGPGTVVVEAAQYGNATYAPATAVQQTIAVGAQSITFAQPVTPAATGTSVTLTATATSGLPVSFEVISGSATISGSTLNYTAPGILVVEAVQAGDGQYAAATPVDRTVTVAEGLDTPGATETATVTITTAGTLGQINVLTQGATGLDFQYVSGGTCATGTSYSIGQTCTVLYTFEPSRPGLRLGAVSLTNNAATPEVMGTVFLSDTGIAPLATFPAGTTINTVGSDFTVATSSVVDSKGDVFVSDAGNSTSGAGTVKEIVAVNGVVTSASAVNTIGSGFYLPYALAIDGSGDIFVANYGTSTVEKIVAVNGAVTSSSAIIPVGSGFSDPDGVAVDGNGNVFVGDTGHSAIKEIVAVDGVVNASSTVNTVGSGFSGPTSVAVDGTGDVFVADSLNKVVKEIVAVNGVVTSNSTVNTLASGFTDPHGLAVDAGGDVFVGDSPGVMEIVAATGATQAVGSGIGSPGSLALDGNGNLVVADTANNQVKEIVLTTPPSLTFVSDDDLASGAQTVVLQNSGNAALTFPISGTGNNPSISSGYTLGDSSTCPQLTTGSSAAGSLALGNQCTDIITFTPTLSQVGTVSGQLVISDNNLYVSPSMQTVTLNGTEVSAVPGVSSISPATGPSVGDTPVIITGTGFTNTTQVSFGSYVINYTIVSDSQIDVVSPPGTLGSTVNITVWNSAGTSAAASNTQFTYVNPQTITFPQPATGVENTSATLTATASSGLPVTYSILSGPATLSGSTVTYTGAGTVVIEANQAGSATYLAAAPVQVSVDVYLSLTEPVGTVSPTRTATVTMAVAGTASAINVLTQGAANLDFNYVSGGTCSATGTYTLGQSCTVFYTFDPTHPWMRYGGVTLTNSAGTVLGQANITATGIGPQPTFTPGTGLDGTQILATGLSSPNGVAVDGSGNVYIADTSHSLVKEYVVASGTVETLGGGFNQPYGVAVDGSGNVYVADTLNKAVKEMPPNCASSACVTSLFDSFALAPGGTEGFQGPEGVAVDGSGNVYVADASDGGSGYAEVYELAPGCTGASCVAALGDIYAWEYPSSIAVDSSGNVYVNDAGYGAIIEMSPSCTSFSCENILSGSYNMGASGVAVGGNGTVYFTKRSGTVNTLAPETCFTCAAPTPVTIADVTNPVGVAVDANGNVYYLSNTGNYVGELDVQNPPTLNFTATSVASTSSNSPQTEIVSNNGNANLTFSGVATSSTNFPLNSTSCSATTTLSPNATCQVGANFSPLAAGALTGTINLFNNSLNVAGSEQQVPLTGTATIGTQTQTITFPQPATPAPSDTVVTLSASSTSGLGITYSVISGPALVSGSTLTYTGVGPVVVEAQQYGNGTYAAATPVSVTMVTTPKAQTVGTTSTTLTAAVTIAAAGTLGTINVLTKGASGTEYKYVSGGTCSTGSSYSVGQTCTVKYSFTPSRPGARPGSVSLTNKASTPGVMGTAFLAGTGNGPLATFPGTTTITTVVTGFYAPSGVAEDGFGDLYVADTGQNLVKEVVAVNGVIPPNPTINVLPSPNSTFANPGGVAVDGSGDLFVTEFGGSAVWEYVAVNGVIPANPTIVSVGGGNFVTPSGVAVDANGNVFVSDWSTNPVKEIVATNGVLSPTAVALGSGIGASYGVAVDGNGNVYVSDTINNEVQEIEAVNGVVPATNPTIVTLGSGIGVPVGIAVDPAGDVFVYVTTNGEGLPVSAINEIVAVNGVIPSNPTIQTIGSGISDRSGLAVDDSGHLFVADYGNNVVKEIDLTTAPTLSLGSTLVTTTSSPQAASVQNSGNTSLTFSGIAFSSLSLPSSYYTLNPAGTTTPCSTSTPLAQSGTCNAAVTFTPPESGTDTGEVLLTDNSLNVSGSQQQVPFTGLGVSGTTAQTITFPQPTTPVANGSAPVALTASASSGLAITYSVSGPATVSGSTLTFTGPGTVVVEAEQFGNATYAAATPAQVTVTVVDVVSYSAPTTAVNTTSATQTATVNFTAAGTLGAINVLTQGAANLDFKLVAGGSCAVGTDYIAGQACTINYSFTPAAPGARLGAVTLYSNATTPVLLGISYLGGTGTGPLALFTNGVVSATASGLNFATAVTVDGAGDIFYAQQGTATISEIAAGSGTVSVVASGINTVTGLAVDGAGNLFYGSYGDNEVYELVSASGTPQPVAAVGTPDIGMTVDDAGNLYVPGGDLVTKIAAGTFAETTFGPVTGSVPGVTVDASDNVYFADFSNNTIYEVTAGTTTPVALVTSGLSGPRGLAVDAAGNLYVANNGASSLVKLTAGTWAPTVIATGYGYDSLMMDQYGTLWSGAGSAVVSVNRGATTAAFPSTVFGNTANLAVSLENDGNAALTISALGVSGTSFTQASATTACSTTTALAVAGTCNVGTTFTPRSVGAFTGDINITDNTLNVTGALQQAALTGTATAATPTFGTMSFSPASSEAYGTSQIVTISDSLSYPGATAPAGAVTFTLNGTPYTATCTGASSPLSCAYAVPAATIAALTTQGYMVTAAYTADANYNATSGASGTFTITKATPTFGTMSFSPASSEAYGTSQIVTISDSLSYAGVTAPTGAVTFTLNGSPYAATCTGAGSPRTCTYAVPAATVAALTAQGYTVMAAYTADASYNAASGVSGTFTINKATPTFGAMSFSPASEAYGASQIVTISDSLSYAGATAPTGTVTFTLNGSPYAATCTGASSPRTCTYAVPAATIAALTAQGYTVTVAYTADSNYNAASGAGGTFTITKATPTLGTMSFSPASEAYGTSQIVTISDSLSYAGVTAPTGAVTFTLNGSPYAATCTGASSPRTCTYAVPAATIAALTAQGYTVTVAYTADSNYNAASGAGGTFTITKATPTLGTMSFSPASEAYGTSQIVTISDSLSYAGATAPTGTVTFTLNGSPYAATCTGASSPRTCTYAVPAATIAALTAQGYTVTVAYTADSNYNAASGAGGTFTITKATPTLGTMSFSPASEAYGTSQIVTISDSLSYAGVTAPTGAVTFTLNGSPYAATCTGASSPRTCTYAVPAATIAALTAQGYTVTVAYTADSNYNATSGASGTFNITKATPTLGTMSFSPASEAYGTSQIVTISVSLSYAGATAPTGAITFTLNGSPYTATCTGAGSPRTCIYAVPAATIAALTAQGYTVTAAYTADANYNATSGLSGTFTITPTSQKVSFTLPASMTYSPGAMVALSASASSGLTVAYASATPSICTVAGNALSVVSAGTCTVTATQPGNTNYQAAQAVSQSITIGKAAAAVNWSTPAAITYGTALSATQLNASASLNGWTVPGSFTYMPTLGTVLTAGAHTLTASFTPADATDYNTPQPATTSITVTDAALTVTANNATRVYGSANPAFIGTVTGGVNGDTFTESFSTSAIVSSQVGTYTIIPSVTGADLADYTQSVTDGTLTITQAGSMTTLQLSSASITPGQSVTLTATVDSTTTGMPTGAVNFYDNGALLNTTPALLSGGVATYAATTLAPGATHTITAMYSGNVNFTGSSSVASSTIAVVPLDFTMTLIGPGNLTVAPGHSISYQMQVTPDYGSYAGTVSFAIAGLPPGATATFSPSSVATNSGPQTITVTIQMAPATAMLHREPPASPGGRHLKPFALAFLVLMGAGTLRKRGKMLRGLLCVMALAGAGLAATMLSGCGGNGGFFGQAPQNYTVTITATAANLQHSTTITLNVQ